MLFLFEIKSKLSHVSFLMYFTLELCKGSVRMQRNIAEVANETRAVALFDFLGGQLVSAVISGCTSFWNIVRHSIIISYLLCFFVGFL